MPRSCTVCQHPELAAINKMLLLKGSSKTEVAERFGVGSSAVQRHRSLCLGHRPGDKQPRADSSANVSSGAVRFESADGRCDKCGQLTGDGGGALDAEAIKKRAEALLYRAERIADRAERDEDARTCLFAIDRCQRSIETLAKISGLMSDAGTTNIYVDNRRKVDALLANLSIEELKALAAGKTVEEIDGDVEVSTLPALPTPQRAQVRESVAGQPVVIDAVVEDEFDPEPEPEPEPAPVRRPSPLPPSRRGAEQILSDLR